MSRHGGDACSPAPGHAGRRSPSCFMRKQKPGHLSVPQDYSAWEAETRVPLGLSPPGLERGFLESTFLSFLNENSFRLLMACSPSSSLTSQNQKPEKEHSRTFQYLFSDSQAHQRGGQLTCTQSLGLGLPPDWTWGESQRALPGPVARGLGCRTPHQLCQLRMPELPRGAGTVEVLPVPHAPCVQ